MSKLDELRAEQQRIQTQIRQLENRNKILLNRDADAQRKARTRRLIEHGAVLESVIPIAKEMTGEEVKVLLIQLVSLPGAEQITRRTEQESAAEREAFP
ncbi:MAG: DUF3847 domain-containing protein [Clostridia bacterium]|nr:DUF3847 domain-containing protein [Clostridia bacterium]